MTLDISFDDRADHLLCVVAGEASSHNLFKLADRIWRESETRARDSVLVDVSGLCSGSLSTMESNDLGLYLAGKPRSVRRLAVVGCTSQGDLHFENVTSNRGLPTRLWKDRSAAQDWLRAAA